MPLKTLRLGAIELSDVQYFLTDSLLADVLALIERLQLGSWLDEVLADA